MLYDNLLLQLVSSGVDDTAERCRLEDRSQQNLSITVTQIKPEKFQKNFVTKYTLGSKSLPCSHTRLETEYYSIQYQDIKSIQHANECV